MHGEQWPWWIQWLPTLGGICFTALTGLMGVLMWLTKDRLYVQKSLDDLLHRVKALEKVHDKWGDGHVLDDKIDANHLEWNRQLTEILVILERLNERVNRRQDWRHEVNENE